jgi:isovaleryl-CoA dehydrogenase
MNAPPSSSTGLSRDIAAPNFDLNAEHKALLEEMTRTARAYFGSDVRQRDLEGKWPEDGFTRLAKMGVLGASVAEEYGGAGLDLFSAGLVGQAIGRVDPAVSTSWQSHDNLCVNNLFQNGTEAQRRKYLPKLSNGTWVGALGMTEPNAGSDALGGMATTAIRDGDHYVLNGSKIYITNGPIADVVLVYAKTAPEKGNKGISAFIVEKAFPGFSASPPFDKMGIRASPTGALYFDNCRVPVENLVGEENMGVAVMMSGLDIERAFCSMMVLGMAERAMQLSVDYAKERRQFGKPIGDFQMVQAKLAEMYVMVETMRGIVYRALAMANAVEAGQAGRGEIHKLSAAAFMYAGEACMKICDEAVQIHGGGGFMRDTEVNSLYRSAKIQEIGGGTKEIRRLIIAHEILAE